jgi:DNA topoisomerase-1
MSDSDVEFEIKDFDQEVDELNQQINSSNKKGNKQLLLVESPKKTAKIASFLDKSFIVKSTKGHIRNLEKKGLGVDVNDNFKPKYEFTDTDHKKIVVDLKKTLKDCHTVWLATDYDREGEGIAWHVYDALNLANIKKIKVHRIIFTEITKKAILNAIKNPQVLDQNMVYSQQTRQILDKLLGYRVSSTLHNRFKNYHLSAGRVQSVACKLIVEREEEISKFESSNFFRVDGIFRVNKKLEKGDVSIKATLDKEFNKIDDARQFIEDCQSAQYEISSIKTTNTKRKPSPPFTTSSLQQEASSKLGYSPNRTMQIAQKLYEGGYITYMRTDSLALSEEVLEQAKDKITKMFGAKYHNETKYKSKNKSSQEAHEACRPCKMDVSDVTSDTNAEQGRLYKMIWGRTMACQMAAAEVEIKTVKIRMDNREEQFVAKGEEIKFDGYLAVWNKLRGKSKNKKDNDDEDDENNSDTVFDVENDNLQIFKTLDKKQKLYYTNINAIERLTKPPHGRYTEASLVKKLEDLEIGRPSTYASIVSTIQNREYVIKKNQEGTVVEGTAINLVYPNKVNEEKIKNKMDAEKNKLFPTELGKLVCEYLVENFDEIMDYKFTANVENMLDEIAQGKKIWHKVIKDVYDKFNPIVEKLIGKGGTITYERLLGQDPETGHNIVVIMARYGPVVCLSHPNDKKQNKYAGIESDQIQSITFDTAMELLKYPFKVGTHNGSDIYIKKGPNGFYLNYGTKNYGLETNEGEYNLYKTLSLNKAIKYIEEKDKEKSTNVLAEFSKGKIRVLNGKYGPYISYDDKGTKVNVKVPTKYDPADISKEECMELINNKLKIDTHKDKYIAKKAKVDKVKAKAKAKSEPKTKKNAEKKEIKLALKSTTDKPKRSKPKKTTK